MFRGRVVLPVRDGDGAVCGLVGRSVNGSGPKYLNSPRTDIYDKSVHLYRPLRARGVPAAHAVVVEGTIDTLALAAAAIATGATSRICPLTQSGRELSPRQVSEIVRQHRGRPVLMLDGDAAGAEATTRLTRAFTFAGRPPIQVDLPAGEDPASWLRQGHPSSLRQLVQHLGPLLTRHPRAMRRSPSPSEHPPPLRHPPRRTRYRRSVRSGARLRRQASVLMWRGSTGRRADRPPPTVAMSSRTAFAGRSGSRRGGWRPSRQSGRPRSGLFLAGVRLELAVRVAWRVTMPLLSFLGMG